ncbi:MAG: VirB4 family type IV secretion/conjugal transfer ATPase [Rhodospirillales bacterium]|nr:VirB4 family type IV secretion/conjugal transfer ATPase [Acetobacter sp.]
MKTLAPYRQAGDGFVDLLNYAAVVDDGVIVNKNGSFMAAWRYTGADAESSGERDKEVVAFRVNQALGPLKSGWAVHVDVVRTPTTNYSQRELSHFPDRVTRAIDEERRAMFSGAGQAYLQAFYLTATWFPPMLAERKFIELMFDDDNAAPNNRVRTHDLITHFQHEIDALESRLSLCFKLERLAGRQVHNEDGSTETKDAFLSHLWRCMSGRSQSVNLPSNPIYLDRMFGQEMHGGVIPRVGGSFLQVVAIDGFPLESNPNILGKLAELPCEYRWSTRFIFMDNHEAARHLEKYRKKWKQKVRGFFDQLFQTNSGRINQHAQEMVDDIDGALAELNGGIVGVGYYTSVVVLFDADRKALDATAKRVTKAINELGFNARVEDTNTLDAFFGSLPGHCDENVRRPLMNTLNLGDLLPTSSIWSGEPQAPCPFYPALSPALMSALSSGNAPFWLNLHVRDIGHTVMFGPTGAGKSTHLAMLVAQLRRYRDISIFFFDKGLSIYPLAMASGGEHYTVGGDGDELAFCPLQYLETKGDRAWAAEWIETILNLNQVQISSAQRNEIVSALENMHASGARTLTDFCLTIQDQAVREGMKQYTIAGAMGHLLDAKEDGLSLSDFTAFEIEELLNLGEKYALPVLLYLFRRIEKSLRGQPAAIVLDEAWIMLGHETFRGKIREWLKVMRKANCLILMATQSLTDAAHSGILDVIVESTATKIFLPNAYAREEDASAFYRRMGLNERQIQLLSEAIPKRQYYYVSEKGRRLYELSLGKLALAFVGASDKESVAVIRQLVARYGREGWVNHWLAGRGLPAL